ncbi:ABC transporter permease [Candidatus Poseidoniaceae archaeon]|nr:ABC transporter permease [Candidatus Poseidoniaceae archaeon]|tara:strand:+ start:404 stop:1255 length:852 start_codon:yes stop_codon:yes gene_type:complete
MIPTGSTPELRVVGKKSSVYLAPWTNLKQIFSNNFLVRNLVRRDVRGRYRNALLGYAWTVIEPTLLSIVYWFLFIMLAGNPDEYYAVWVLIGVVVWSCFGKSLMSSVTSLTGNTRVIHLVFFPRIIFPSTAMLANIVVTTMSSLVVIPIILAYGFPFGIHLVLIPAGIFISGLMGMGLGIIFAPLNCLHKDIEHLFRFIVRAGFFVSPVMWTYEMAMERGVFGEIVMWNPMVVPITIARHGLMGKWPDIPIEWIAYSLGVTLLLWIIGNIIFEKYEREAVKHL